MNTRYGKLGEVIWSGKGIFATPDRRIALMYTNSRSAFFHQGIDLGRKYSEHDPILLTIYGGKTQIEESLYGTPRPGSSFGYIYCMDASNFWHEDGLADMELVSKTPVKLAETSECPDGIQKINRRTELEHYLDAGLIQLKWISEADDPLILKNRSGKNNK